jgi:AcrR family transcriptional regulator
VRHNLVVSQSPRRTELVEAAYEYVLANGLADMSLRPIADAIGSSTGVLRFLFGSRDGLVAAVLQRARADELAMLAQLPAGGDLLTVAGAVWDWLADPAHEALLRLWTESYATSLHSGSGPWAGFAASTVQDWLTVLAAAQPPRVRNTAAGRAQRTAVLAVLRGAMLDVLATGDRARTTRAVRAGLSALVAA